MKKSRKIGLGIAIAFIVVVILLAIWQWNNLKAFYMGITYSNEKIEKKIDESKEKLAKELEKEGIVNDKIVTGFSKEDEAKLKKGELSVEEAVEKLFESESNTDDKSDVTGKAPDSQVVENNSSETTASETLETQPKEVKKNNIDIKDKNESEDAEKPTDSKAVGEKTSNNKGNTEQSVDNKENSTSADSSKDIIETAVKEMYTLKARFVQRLATIERNAKRVYIKGEMNMDSKLKIADAFMPQFVAAEKECDTQVEKILGKLKSDLEAIGADTSVIQSIREQYNNEKELQKSKYISEYL